MKKDKDIDIVCKAFVNTRKTAKNEHLQYFSDPDIKEDLNTSLYVFNQINRALIAEIADIRAELLQARKANASFQPQRTKPLTCLGLSTIIFTVMTCLLIFHIADMDSSGTVENNDGTRFDRHYKMPNMFFALIAAVSGVCAIMTSMKLFGDRQLFIQSQAEVQLTTCINLENRIKKLVIILNNLFNKQINPSDFKDIKLNDLLLWLDKQNSKLNELYKESRKITLVRPTPSQENHEANSLLYHRIDCDRLETQIKQVYDEFKKFTNNNSNGNLLTPLSPSLN